MSISFHGFNESVCDSRGFPQLIELDDEDSRGVNVSNGNGVAFLGFLGIQPCDSDGSLCGRVPVYEARRAIMKARATFNRRAEHFTRPTTTEGHLKVDGVIQFSTPRMYAMGIDADYLARTLERFAVLVEALAGLGATHICWS